MLTPAQGSLSPFKTGASHLPPADQVSWKPTHDQKTQNSAGNTSPAARYFICNNQLYNGIIIF